MTKKDKFLIADGIINIAIGLLLLSFPFGIGDYLGMPAATNDFYATILGGVIFGIGLALFIEKFSGSSTIRGLGLAGAIAINLCGGNVLLIWLLISPFDLPVHGTVILWIIAVLVLGIGLLELFTKSWENSQ
jgi:hypothetical protein